jgi:hypothetical protein
VIIKPFTGTFIKRQIFVTLLLALFLAPSLIQALHHHDHAGAAIQSRGQGSMLSKYEHCFICSFEFVSFLKTDPVTAAPTVRNCRSLPTELREGPSIPCFLILADRAPPLV